MDKKDKQLELLRGMERLKAAPIKSEDYTSPLDQDVIRVKGSPAKQSDILGTIKNATEKIDTQSAMPTLSGSSHKEKIAKLLALKHAGKKALSVLPFAGAGMAALQGEPAMAAEELASDLTGPAGDALRSEAAGMSSGDERMMLAEDQARKDYAASPAKKDRIAKLKAMLGK